MAGARGRMKREEATPKESYNFDAQTLLNHCIAVIQRTEKGKKAEIIVPVEYEKKTKFNKVRFHRNDKTSPIGNVIRDDPYADVEYSTAVAKFDAYALARWIGLWIVEHEMKIASVVKTQEVKTP